MYRYHVYCSVPMQLNFMLKICSPYDGNLRCKTVKIYQDVISAKQNFGGWMFMCLSQRLCYSLSSMHWNWCQAIICDNVLSCWFNRLHWHFKEWWKKCISCCSDSLASAVNCLRSVFYLLESTWHQLPPVNNFNKLDNTTHNGSFNKVFCTLLHWPPPVWGRFVDLFLWNNS